MRNALRLVAVLALVSFALGGPLSPSALAQQPTSPDLIQERLRESAPSPGTDVYDVGAGVLTAAKAPFNVGLCLLGTLLGATVFGLTLGSGYQATTRVIEEGCARKWVVTGDDIRPHQISDKFDYPSSRR
jgi:hypothetical protein